MRFRSPPKVISEQERRESLEKQIAWEYAVFKAPQAPFTPSQNGTRAVIKQEPRSPSPPPKAPRPPIEAPPIIPANAQIKQEIIDLTDSPPGSPRNATPQTFFAALLAMETKFGHEAFEWTEIEREYVKLFNETLTLNLLIRVFEFDPKLTLNVRCFINARMRLVLNMLPPSENHGIRVQFLKTAPAVKKNMVGHSVRIAVEYAEFKASQGFASLNQTSLPQAPFSSVEASPSVSTGVEIKRETKEQIIDLTESPSDTTRLFPLLYALEKKHADRSFNYTEFYAVYEQLFHERILPAQLKLLTGGTADHSVRYCLLTLLSGVFEEPEKSTFKLDIRFVQGPLKKSIIDENNRARAERLARDYAAFKASLSFVAELLPSLESSSEAPSPPTEETPPESSNDTSTSPISFFSALLAIEKKYSQNVFKWAELEQEYQRLFNETLSIDVVKRNIGGNQSIINIADMVCTELSSILKYIDSGDEGDKTPRVRFRRMFETKFCFRGRDLAIKYAAFKQSQGFVTELNEQEPDVNIGVVGQIRARLFPLLYALERKHAYRRFNWPEMCVVYEQLFNERLLRTTLALLVGGNPNATIRYCLFTLLSGVLQEPVKGTYMHDMRFVQGPVKEDIFGKYNRAQAERLAREYAAFKEARKELLQEGSLDLQIPSSEDSNEHIFSPSDQIQLGNSKEMEGGKENVDADEPKIKKVKTEDDVKETKVKEEPEVPRDGSGGAPY